MRSKVISLRSVHEVTCGHQRLPGGGPYREIIGLRVSGGSRIMKSLCIKMSRYLNTNESEIKIMEQLYPVDNAFVKLENSQTGC